METFNTQLWRTEAIGRGLESGGDEKL